MKQIKISTKVAGIDVGKARLDAAVHGLSTPMSAPRTAEGVLTLIERFKAHGVGRVGLEATGGYERMVVSALQAAGLEVVVHQPMEVRLFARLKRQRAKSDRIDAQIIAAATAHTDAVTAAREPLLHELAERLTAYEQITDLAATLKTACEHIALPDLMQDFHAQIRALTVLKRKLAAEILTKLKAHPQLGPRHALLMSLKGVGPLIAAALIVRMPELGAMKRGQAASLLGVAPFDRDSGTYKGQRFIAGGRSRPRRMLYLAAIVAKRCDPAFKAFAKRLTDKGKPAKVAIVAVMRKLIEAANLILARGQPWLDQAPT
jgi:transposase